MSGGSGGRRNGAGRKKGVPNKSTAARKAALAATGKSPLDFMLTRLNDGTLEAKERMHAAVSAAPHLHPRLTAVDARVSGDITVEIVRFGDES